MNRPDTTPDTGGAVDGVFGMGRAQAQHDFADFIHQRINQGKCPRVTQQRADKHRQQAAPDQATENIAEQ